MIVISTIVGEMCFMETVEVSLLKRMRRQFVKLSCTYAE